MITAYVLYFIAYLFLMINVFLTFLFIVYYYRYPMAIGNLGDLEEISPTDRRPSPVVLFTKAIDSSVRHYEDHHVYPYTYLGGYYYRKGLYKEALRNWAEAANAIKK